MQACSYVLVLCSCLQGCSFDSGLDVGTLESGSAAEKKIQQRTFRSQDPDGMLLLFLVMIHNNMIPCI